MSPTPSRMPGDFHQRLVGTELGGLRDGYFSSVWSVPPRIEGLTDGGGRGPGFGGTR